MSDANSGACESPAAKHVLVSDHANRQECECECECDVCDVIPGGCTRSG
jgi:hypothetical protein